ncbi:unnamed protein product [Caenorhabditis nigoni]
MFLGNVVDPNNNVLEHPVEQWVPEDKMVSVSKNVVYKKSDIQCQYFRFGTISTIQQADSREDEIALKIRIPPDECPISNPLVPGPTYYTQIINSQFYKTTVSSNPLSNNIYNLTYSVSTCPNNTKLFQRGETTVVCIGLYFFETPLCNNQPEASALCKAQSGTLTGPLNADEYKYIQDVSTSSKYTSNPNSYSWLTYWIDGESTNTEYDYIFEDPTHEGSANYQWTPRSPANLRNPGFCLHNPGPSDTYVMDFPCTFPICCKDQGYVCWRGALCQVPPITISKYL